MKDPSRLGKGAIEGVIAPGASTNAKDGGQLIPTLLFGIPGGASMALVLTALVVVGIAPGPSLVADRDGLTLLFAAFWVLIIAQIIGGAMGTLLIKPLTVVLRIPAPYMVPALLATVISAAYVSTNSMFGVYVTIAVGLIWRLLAKYGWSRPAFVLALLLGNSAERYLFISYNTYGWSWVAHPVVIVIGTIIVLQLARTVFMAIKARNASQAKEVDEHGVHS